MPLMCRVLGVSRSGYYAWRTRGTGVRRRRDTELIRWIREIHAASRSRSGSPRVHREMQSRGIACGRRRVARLMRQTRLRGIAARRRKPRLPSVDRRHLPNRVLRDFSTGKLNRVWAADLTYVRTAEGWLFLAVVLDVGSRRVVGWAMGGRADCDLVIRALDMAIVHRQPGPGLVHHSDRGVHYTSSRYRSSSSSMSCCRATARWETAGTMPWSKASSIRSRRKRLAASTPAGRKPGTACSISLRCGITDRGGTPHSAT